MVGYLGLVSGNHFYPVGFQHVQGLVKILRIDDLDVLMPVKFLDSVSRIRLCPFYGNAHIFDILDILK